MHIRPTYAMPTRHHGDVQSRCQTRKIAWIVKLSKVRKLKRANVSPQGLTQSSDSVTRHLIMSADKGAARLCSPDESTTP